jgi:hypothetical protein
MTLALLLVCLHAEPDSLSRLALRSALKTFETAFVRADAEALDTMLAPHYLHTNGSSGAVLQKVPWLAYIRRRRADLEAGRLRVDRYESTGTRIAWYPGAAVVSTLVASEGTENGARFSRRLQVTTVWVRSGQGWRRAAFHDSPVP